MAGQGGGRIHSRWWHAQTVKLEWSGTLVTREHTGTSHGSVLTIGRRSAFEKNVDEAGGAMSKKCVHLQFRSRGCLKVCALAQPHLLCNTVVVR